MDFFGIGPLEIILVLIIGLIIFGPGKLPQIGRDVGKALRSFKKAASDISAEMSREMKELEEKEQDKKSDSQPVQPKMAETDKTAELEAGKKTV